MTTKKILGIVLATIFGILFCGGLFALVLVLLLLDGYAVWFSLLMAFAPFVGTAIIVGVSWLIVYLLYD